MLSCLASSTVTESASRLIGLSRSARSARALRPESRQSRARNHVALRAIIPILPATRLRKVLIRGSLMLRVVIGAFNTGQQFEDARLAVQLQSYCGNHGVRITDGDRLAGGGRILVGNDMQEGRAHRQPAGTAARLARSEERRVGKEC